jgi:hypothetical protein
VLYVPLLVKPDFLVVEAVNHSVYYDISRSPVIRVLSFEWCQLLYLLIVATPPLLGEKRGFFIFGIAIVASAAASHVFFWYASASVWCFFAVALSSYLCFSFWRLPTPALLRTV